MCIKCTTVQNGNIKVRPYVQRRSLSLCQPIYIAQNEEQENKALNNFTLRNHYAKNALQ